MPLTKVSFSMIKGQVLNVLDFGADSSGVADSSAAIQAAIDKLSATGYGGVVFLPVGDYKCNTGLDLKALVRLVGENLDSTNIRYTGNGTAVSIAGSVGNLRVKAGLENLSVYGNASSQYGVYVSYATDCVFLNIRVYQHNIGFYLNWSYNNLLSSILCDGNAQDGFYFDNEANANPLIGCRGSSNGRAGLFMLGGRAVEAVNCTWEANTQYGVYLLGNDTTATYRPKSLTLSTCYIEGNGTAEVFITNNVGKQPPLGIVIENCYFCGLVGKASQAIRVANIEGLYINGCTFDDQGVAYANSLYVPAGGSVSGLIWGENVDRSSGKVYQGLPITDTPKSMAKAWGQFLGKGSVTLNTIYGVSSIVRNSTGVYTVTLEQARPASSYPVLVTVEDGSLGSPGLIANAISTSSTQFLITIFNTSNVATDGRTISFVVF